MDVNRTAVSGDWLVSQDRQGGFSVFDLSGPYPVQLAVTDLADANAHLARHGCPPVSDADFHTFEEWAELRTRRRVALAGSGLAAVVAGWLVVGGVVFVTRRRRSKSP